MSIYPETIITEALFAHLKAMLDIPTYPSGYLLSGYVAGTVVDTERVEGASE